MNDVVNPGKTITKTATGQKTLLKSEITFFQSLSRQFHVAYFVKCRRTLLELNS